MTSKRRTLTVQQRKVLAHLLSGSTLTSLEAHLHLGVGRLASRVSELLKMGVEIAREYPEKGKRYVAYRLLNPPAAKRLLEEGPE